DRPLGRRPDRRSPGRCGQWFPEVVLFVFKLFRPPKYLEVRPRPRERPGSTKTGPSSCAGTRSGEGWVTGNPFWQGVGIVAAWFAARTCCSGNDRVARSEEHTSELQSLTNLVCRLL